MCRYGLGLAGILWQGLAGLAARLSPEEVSGAPAEDDRTLIVVKRSTESAGQSP